MAPHSSTLVWKIPWMEEPGGLQSMGSLRVRHDWTTSLSRIGDGNGSPLQCSCLENPRAGGAWWAAVYRVAQSGTQLKWLSSSSSSSMSSCMVLLKILYGIVLGRNDFARDSHLFRWGRNRKQEWQLLKNVVFSFPQQPKDAETLPTCLLAGHQGIQGLDTSFVRIQISINKRKRMKTEPEDARVNTQWSAPVCSAIKTNSNYTLVWYLLHFRNFYSALCPFPSITSQVLI